MVKYRSKWNNAKQIRRKMYLKNKIFSIMYFRASCVNGVCLKWLFWVRSLSEESVCSKALFATFYDVLPVFSFTIFIIVLLTVEIDIFYFTPNYSFIISLSQLFFFTSFGLEPPSRNQRKLFPLFMITACYILNPFFCLIPSTFGHFCPFPNNASWIFVSFNFFLYRRSYPFLKTLLFLLFQYGW